MNTRFELEHVLHLLLAATLALWIAGCRSSQSWQNPQVLTIEEIGKPVQGPVQLHMPQAAWEYASVPVESCRRTARSSNVLATAGNAS